MIETILLGRKRATGEDVLIAGREVPFRDQVDQYKDLCGPTNDEFENVVLAQVQPHKKPLKFITVEEAEARAKAQAEAEAKAKKSESGKVGGGESGTTENAALRSELNRLKGVELFELADGLKAEGKDINTARGQKKAALIESIIKSGYKLTT